MKVEVLEYNEDEGIITLDLDEDGQKFLLERGLNAILKDAFEIMIKENENA